MSSSQTNNPLLVAALSYAQRGWAVFPLHYLNSKNDCSCTWCEDHKTKRSKCGCVCKSPGKHPATSIFPKTLPHGVKNATTDIAQINQWWSINANCNVGIATGTASGGLVVVDYDEKSGGLNHLNLIAGSSVEIKTGGGGIHRYYQGDGTIQNSQSKLAPGVDVRGTGGYVVAPPSLHVSGNHYEWASDGDLPPFPLQAIWLLQQPKQTPQSNNGNLFDTDDEDIWVSDTTLLPQEAIDGQTSRHNLLLSIAGRLHNAGLVGSELDAALQAVNLKRCNPPKSASEVTKIARWVDTKPGMPVTPAQPAKPSATVNPAQAAPAPRPAVNPNSYDDYLKANPTNNELEIVNLSDILNTIYAPEEPICLNLHRGQWGLIVALSNLGKSTLLFNLCLSLACGRPFLPVTEEEITPKKILYLDYEQRQRDLQWNFKRMVNLLPVREQILAEQNLHFVCPPERNGQPFLVSEAEGQKVLAEMLKKGKYDLCVIDTLSQATWLNDENSNSEVQRKVVMPFRRIGHFSGCAIIAVHHEGKGGEKSEGDHSAQLRTRGASALVSGARWQLSLIPTKPELKGRFKVRQTKAKGEAGEWVEMEIDKETRWCMQLQTVTASPSKPTTLREMILAEVASRTDATTLDDFVLCFPQHSRNAIKIALTRAVADGELLRGKRGEYRLSGSADNDDLDDANSPVENRGTG